MGNALSPPLLGDVRNGKFIKWPLSESLPITHMCPTLCFTRRLTLAFSLVAQQSRICPQCMRCRLNPWVRKIPWRRVWQPTPLFLPGESHGQRSLVGYTVHRVTKIQTQLSAHSKCFDKANWSWNVLPSFTFVIFPTYCFQSY